LLTGPKNFEYRFATSYVNDGFKCAVFSFVAIFKTPMQTPLAIHCLYLQKRFVCSKVIYNGL